MKPEQTSNPKLIRADYSDATPDEREAALRAWGLSLEARFVPLSESRNAYAGKPAQMGMGDLSLNWRVALLKDGRKLIETDYMQGIGHAPNYSHADRSVDAFNALRYIAETGRDSRTYAEKRIPLPTLTEVCYSLASDAQAGQESFEDFCGSFGYDPDSRKAEATWRVCADIYAKLGARVTEQISKIVEGY